MWFWALIPGLLCLVLNILNISGVHVQLGCSFVFSKWQFLSPVVYAIVLHIMLWFWIHFEQIFHTSPAACGHPIGSHSPICFSPLQTQMLFFSPLALTQSKPVGRLQSYVPTLPFHSSTVYSCSHNSLSRGPQKFGWRGASLLAYSKWNHTPISFLMVLQSCLWRRIIQYPHTQHLQVTQLSTNHICRFWHQSLPSKAAQQQWEGEKPTM